MGYCFGIDIGGTTVKIGLAAEDGTLLEGWEIPTRREPTPEGLLLDIRVSILDRLDRGLDGEKKQKIRIFSPPRATFREFSKTRFPR